MRIALLTESRYEKPTDPDWYVQNILTEDGLVEQALQDRGVDTIRLDWARPGFDWTSVDAALFRTTWDYFHRFAEFQSWLDRAGAQTNLVNPLEQIRWNMDKHYMADLEKAGIRIVPTLFLEPSDPRSLQEIQQKTAWNDIILKPAVSGAARHTYRLNPDNIEAHEAIFRELIAVESMLLQPFQQDIINRGEVSLMVMDGQFTHAVLKVAKQGDFRVQDDFGGSVHDYLPTAEEIQFAEAAVAACKPRPLYARVDILRDNEGQLALGELELIEPELWFRKNPAAAGRLADGLIRYLSRIG